MRLLFLVLVLISRLSFSQDSLIYFNELEFASEKEKEIYTSIFKNNPSFLFEAFYSVASHDTSKMVSDKRSFYYQMDQLTYLKRNSNLNKYVRKIYDELHEIFLRKYDELVTFDQIFENGIYNCVTACAIYGLAFDQLNIPYTIKETPTHVYIVAFPGGDQVVIETTNPTGGFKSFSTTFKKSYVTLLQEQKIIDRAELAQGTEKLFNKYYYSKDEVDLKQLVGIQYYNVGIGLFNDKKYEDALICFEKAFLLYDSEQIRDMIFASLSSIVYASSYKKTIEVESLGKISRFSMYDIKSTEIVGEFGRLTQQQLITSNDTVLYKKSYESLVDNIHSSDSTLRRDIDYIYFYERARILYNRALYDEALPFAQLAFQIKPENIDSETLLFSCFTTSYRDEEPKLVLDRLNKLIIENPSLKRNFRFGSILLNLYLLKMRDDFINKRYSEGFQMKKKFEHAQEKNEKYRFDEVLAGNAYSQLVAYYFRKGQLTNARKALNTGFKYAPNHSELRTRQYMLNR